MHEPDPQIVTRRYFGLDIEPEISPARHSRRYPLASYAPAIVVLALIFLMLAAYIWFVP